MKMLPFLSSGWYFRAATAFLLDRGKITWDNIKYVFNSTAHLRHDAFAPAIPLLQGQPFAPGQILPSDKDYVVGTGTKDQGLDLAALWAQKVLPSYSL